MTFKMSPVPALQERGWKIYVDGNKIAADMVEFRSERWGHLTYGFRPEGFDSWTFKTRTNAVTVPYSIVGWWKRTLLVGLLLENRPNLGGETLCVIGGFTDPGETIDEAQKREADEEAGLVGRARAIGSPMYTDRLFWDGSENGYGGNVPFVQRVSSQVLVRRIDRWYVRGGKTSPFKDFKKAENLVFLPWADAVEACQDGIALAALAHVRRAYDRGQL